MRKCIYQIVYDDINKTCRNRQFKIRMNSGKTHLRKMEVSTCTQNEQVENIAMIQANPRKVNNLINEKYKEKWEDTSEETWKMLKRREECYTYLTHVYRRHSSGDSPEKRWNIRSFSWKLSYFLRAISATLMSTDMNLWPSFQHFFIILAFQIFLYIEKDTRLSWNIDRWKRNKIWSI